MTDKDKYLCLEMLLTFLLLFLVISLFGEILSSYRLYLIFGLLCGFSFSWFIRNKENPIIRYLVATGVLGTFLWLVYSILNSSFLYRDVVLICIKAVIFLEIILCFNVYLFQYLSYMQALSVPLFMCFPLFIKRHNESLIIPILLYFICWLVLLRVKFYEFIKKPLEEINFKRNYAVILIIIIFVIGLSLSGILFSRFPLGKTKKGVLFPEEGFALTESGGANLDEEYYDLQDKLLKKMMDLLPDIGSTEDKYAILGLLNYLIKESSTIMEVEKAEQGLISYLKTPGLGLEKGEGKETIVLLRSYVDKKIAVVLKRIQESVMNNLKKNPFNIKSIITISSLASKIRYSDSPPQVSEYEKQLKEAINNSSLESNVKKELIELSGQLKDWKDFEFYHQKIYPSQETMVLPEKEDLKGTQEERREPEVREERAEDLKENLKAKTPSLNLNVGTILERLMRIVLNAIFFVIIGSIILFIVFYFLTKNRKNRLVSLYRNPREFILSLYENMKEVLVIFGMRYREALAPLAFAELVEKRYSIKNNLFLNFTTKFEEAKYSSHILESTDVYSALNDYNNFLKVLFSDYNKFILVLKYCSTLIHKRPLYIKSVTGH